MPPTALLLDPVFAKHDPGPGHPEQIARYTAITKRLQAADLDRKTLPVKPRTAITEELALVHSAKYIELAHVEARRGTGQLSTGDTTLGEHTLECALDAVGGAMAAVDLVIEKKVRNAFCAVRPPGHHATPNAGMGFCLFNNIAVAARYAQKKHHIDKVAIIDWDVHHGNGTQDTFYEDDSVLFFSTHQHPLYPGTGLHTETGEGEGSGFTINCPLPAGSGMKDVRTAFTKQLLPALQRFKPEMLFISAGFDSRKDDPLGDFLLDDVDFAELTTMVCGQADTLCEGRVVSLLEGGYNTGGLASAVESHLRALIAANGDP